MTIFVFKVDYGMRNIFKDKRKEKNPDEFHKGQAFNCLNKD